MVAKRLRHWLSRLGTKTVYITPGSPWENGYCESFNGKLRDKLLNIVGVMRNIFSLGRPLRLFSATDSGLSDTFRSIVDSDTRPHFLWALFIDSVTHYIAALVHLAVPHAGIPSRRA
jgi:hypothetical protein